MPPSASRRRILYWPIVAGSWRAPSSGAGSPLVRVGSSISVRLHRRLLRTLLFHEDATEDLADRRLGKLGAELDLPRHLERGEVKLAERGDLVGGRLGPGLEDDERLHRLAAIWIGHAGDRGFLHLRVEEEHLLDLARQHLQPRGDD